ncbi:MAG: hypothetical protein HUJ57_02720 [Erysipelotrichaceae bacterium]|nr:hypothetical protein [Erysipelotrichaceae bacterium]
MAKNQTKALDLKGLNIYHDRRHGTVYYDILTRNGYVILNQDVNKLLLNDMGFPIAILAYFLMQNMGQPSYVNTLVAIAAWAVCKLLFRILFLYRLPVVKNYVPEGGHKSFVERFAATYNRVQLIIVTVLGTMIFIATIAYVILGKITGFDMICLVILALIGLALAIICLMAIRKQDTTVPANKKKGK